MPIPPLDPNSLRRDDPFVAAVLRYFEGFGRESPPPQNPIDGYLAGGVGVRCYVGARTTGDVDMFFRGGRVLIPPNTVILAREGGREHGVVFDHQYTPDFGLLHPDDDGRAVELARTCGGMLFVKVLHPVDFAVTKVARFEDHDRADIKALAGTGSFDREAFVELAEEALGHMVGNPAFARGNLAEAAELIESAQLRKKDR
jgi:hypothetical protein